MMRTKLLHRVQERVEMRCAEIFANSRDMAGKPAKLYSFKRRYAACILRRSIKCDGNCTMLVRLFPGSPVAIDTCAKLTPKEYVCFYRNNLSPTRKVSRAPNDEGYKYTCQYKVGWLSDLKQDSLQGCCNRK
jgi:hypothetical protein